MTQFVCLKSDGWTMWVDRNFVGELDARDPLDCLRSLARGEMRNRPMADVWCIDCNAGPCYVKHFKPVPGHGGLWRRLRRLIRRSLALHCMRVAERMRRTGVATAPVVLAGRRRVGRRREHVLVTRDVPGENLQAALFAADSRTEQRRLVELAAEHIAALHRAGFVHGDLLPGNLIVSPDRAQLSFVDNDRTTVRPAPLASRGRRRNVEQIVYRLYATTRAEVTRAFIERYCRSMGMGRARARRFEHHVLQHVRQRLAAGPRDRHWQKMVTTP